jgi:hypothetical protein
VHKRLQALEKRLAPPRGDLREEIRTRALAAALSPEQLQQLRDVARVSGSARFPPEWVAERELRVVDVLLAGRVRRQPFRKCLPSGAWSKRFPFGTIG